MKIDTVIIVTARLGSTRLPRKHMLPVLGKPIVGWLLDRIKFEFKNEVARDTAGIVIATSDEAENREFEMFRPMGATTYYGHTTNIPLRHLGAARSVSATKIIAVDGDDILCSTAAMRKALLALERGAKFAKTTGLPLGMNCAGYTTDFLAESLGPNPAESLEMGWHRVFDEKQMEEIPMKSAPGAERLRFTLDYDEDYQFFNKVITALGDNAVAASDDEIIETTLKNRLHEINGKLSEEYWANFNRELRNETGDGERN